MFKPFYAMRVQMAIKRKLLRKIKTPSYFEGVKNLLVDNTVTIESSAQMIKDIFTDWLIKWDNELRHGIKIDAKSTQGSVQKNSANQVYEEIIKKLLKREKPNRL